jgi:glutaredoxin-related protein
MLIKRAYDMLNQLERHFFGGYDILPFETTREAVKRLSQWISPTMGQLDISKVSYLGSVIA